jgi:hypothetical protein
MTKNTQSARAEPPPPTDFVEEDPTRTSSMPGPVVRVIVGLALLWILILAYFVAEMPAK